MSIPPLTRSIGTVERSLRALLERELSGSGLSFPQWTTLVFTSSADLSIGQIAQRQLAGHIVTAEAETKEAVDGLLRERLLSANSVNLLQHTEKGRDLFAGLSKAIEALTASLYGDLSQPDLEATHRTLLAIADRAAKLLAAE